MMIVFGLGTSSIILLVYNLKVSNQVSLFCYSDEKMSEEVFNICNAYKKITQDSNFYKYGTVGVSKSLNNLFFRIFKSIST